MTTLAQWLLPLLIAARPTGHALEPLCSEPEEDYAARVESHIACAQAATFDTHEPPFVPGPWSRERAMVQALAIAHHESHGFCRGVDSGQWRGDHGASGCAMGLMFGVGSMQLQAVIDDLCLCYKIGAQRMRLSWPRCSAYPDPQLRVYSSGRCDRGGRESRDMLNQGAAWWTRAKSAWETAQWELE